MSWNRKLCTLWLVGFALLVSFTGTTNAGDPNACDEPGEAPDILVGSIDGPVVRWGTVGDVTAYSVGLRDCNIGTCWADNFANTPLHPAIAQNLFRLENGRFEQIGQSWIRHTFFALSQVLCSEGCLQTNGMHLGVNCTDTHSSNIQGQQQYGSPRHEVDITTGQFPFPPATFGATGNAIYKRLQVHDADLDPTEHPNGSYFFEVQLIARDDAAAGNAHNNASYRLGVLSSSEGIHNFTLTGPTERGKAAIHAWRASDPSVVETIVDVPGDGRLILAAKVTDRGDGTFDYEYALQNLDSSRSVRSFTVPLSATATVSDVGFHDVDYHSANPDGSGSFFDGTDWATSTTASQVSWSTEDATSDPLANALRWGTLYNFRFRSDAPPTAGSVSLGLFVPGSPAAVAAGTLVPAGCDGDGVCDPDETCSTCPGDCADQGQLGGCCGDGTCDAGESSCTCSTDCGAPAAAETVCANGLDDDCDGTADCADSDCCANGACGGADPDADSYAMCDCDANDPDVWSTPGPVEQLLLSKSHDMTLLAWNPPAEPGGSSVSFEALRSEYAQSFMMGTICLTDPDPSDLTLSDPDDPPPSSAYFYLVRATNGCPAGTGSLGGSAFGAREGMTCP